MEILYWNIGKGLTCKKEDWINEILKERKPEVFCVAEGPTSIEKTQDFISSIEQLGYSCYYNPNFYSLPVIFNQYEWTRFGLKVFIKDGYLISSTFDFSCQQVDGRIIYLKLDIQNKTHLLFLIHGTSKVGKIIDQHAFIVELSQFIRTKARGYEDDNIIIMGDFNIEPWDDKLNDNRYIKSCFNRKSFNYHSNMIHIHRLYINPILEHIDSNSNSQLIGTFYNSKYVSILDFTLFSEHTKNFQIEVIDKINLKNIIIHNNTKHILVDEFDHLPLSTKLN